jgi:prepilin-type N-terminal cleavage/methylation domain-containing protein
MQKSSPTAASQQGFTLVEVMMASLVMVMMFIAALASIQQGFTMLDTARNTTLAGQIIQSEIEDLRLKQYLSLPASGTIDLATTIGSGLSEAERTALSTRFTATRQVVDVPGRTGTAPDGTPIATLKRVIIAVEWRDYSHRLHSRAYETLVGYNGLSDYFATTHGSSSP